MAPEEVEKLEAEFREAGTEASNNLLRLIKAFEASFESGGKDALVLMHALRRCFSIALETGDLEDAPSDAEEVVQKVTAWLKKVYARFVAALQDIVTDGSETVMQVAALRTLMHLIQLRGGRKPRFDAELFGRMVETILTQKTRLDESSQIIRVLKEEYVDAYVDVRIHLLKAIRNCCTEASEEGSRSSAFVDNAFLVLYTVPCDLDESLLADESRLWVPTSKLKSVRAFKKAFEGAWISFLQLGDFGTRQFRQVMVCLPNHVLPGLQNPLLLSDFLTEAYNERGVLAMMALSSLFVLISEHQLDYPNFYEKLYALLDEETFNAKYKSRFFDLLGRVLSSAHLASYLVAAFAKRIARLALKAPPGSAMFAVVIISNLLKNHPTCLSLVHQPSAAELAMDRGDFKEIGEDINAEKRAKLDAIKESSLLIASGNDKKRRRSEVLFEDPFIFEEDDPAKCRATKSCLWEIQTLSKHYSPKVSSLVSTVFEKELKQIVETKRIHPAIPLDSFSSINYRLLFEQEIRKSKKRKEVSLNFDLPSKTNFVSSLLHGK